MDCFAATKSARFGLDMGGTLCKLVFFQPTGEECCDDPPFQNTSRQKKSLEGCESSRCFKGTENLCAKKNKGESSGYFGETENAEGIVANAVACAQCSCDGKIWGDAGATNSRLWASSHYPISVLGKGMLFFKRFETWRIEEFLALTRKYSLLGVGGAIGATGGGARKFGDKFQEMAGLKLQLADELTSLVMGIDFLVRVAPQDCFVHPTDRYSRGSIQRPLPSPESSSSDDADDRHDSIDAPDRFHSPISSPSEPDVSNKRKFERVDIDRQRQLAARKPIAPQKTVALHDGDSLYPYLVVNVGSGVSILRVDSANSFKRVGGTSVGGSTFLGLTSMLTGCESFEEAIKMATRGDSTSVDMLVGDIYGGDYEEMGLASTTVASSFGKLAQPANRRAARETPEDLAKAALLMVTNNVGSIAMLHALPAGVRNIVFSGSFMHNNKLAVRLFSVAVDFWSKGEMRAIFLKHEGHAGAIGALLSNLEASDPVGRMLLEAAEGGGEEPETVA